MQINPAIEKQLLTTAERLAVTDAAEFLVRSKSEILRILNGILEQHALISLNFSRAEYATYTSLVSVDENANTMLMVCPPEWRGLIDKGDNTSVMFACAFEDSKIQFQGTHGALNEMGGVPVVHVAIPTFLWRFQRRREARYRVTTGPALKIMLNLGFIESEAEVADLGVNAVGAIYCDNDVKLEQDEILRGCAITLPGVGKVGVDLKVRHQTLVSVTDGSRVTRVGCEFVGLSDDARLLITQYIAALTEI